jgi:hypothetical protein
VACELITSGEACHFVNAAAFQVFLSGIAADNGDLHITVGRRKS